MQPEHSLERFIDFYHLHAVCLLETAIKAGTEHANNR